MDHLRPLAELLAGPPDPRRWDAICDLLDRDPDPELCAAALAGLESWPDELREAPGHWLAAAARGENLPQLQIVRCIRPQLAMRRKLGRQAYETDYVRKELLQRLLGDPLAWAAILRSPHMADVRIVELLQTSAEVAVECQRDIDESRAPLEPADVPARRIASLARTSLPKLHTLRLLGAAAPLPAPPTLPPTNWRQHLVRVFTGPPKSEWQRLLAGPGRSVEHWQLDGVSLDSDLFDAFTYTRGLARWRSLDLRPVGRFEPDIGRLLRLPVAATLESLRIQYPVRLHDLDGLRLPALRKLALAGVDQENCDLHCATKLFPALTQVSLRASRYSSRIDAHRLSELLQPDLAGRIESLRIVRHEFQVLESLLGRNLPNLTTLGVDGVDGTVLAKLAGNLPRLECLTARGLRLTADVAERLGDLPLRELTLDIPVDEPPVVEPLLHGAGRPERLHLRFHGAVHEDQVASFARSAWLSGVRELRLSASSGVDDRTLTALLSSPQLAGLEILQLYSSKSEATLTPLRHLARPSRLHSLGLSVASIRIDDVDIFVSGPWHGLHDLYLADIDLDQPEYHEVRRHWLRAALPGTIKQTAFTPPHGWTLSDCLRLPPSPDILRYLEINLRRGVDAEQLEEVHWRACSWPEPLRSELYTIIAAASRIDADR